MRRRGFSICGCAVLAQTRTARYAPRSSLAMTAGGGRAFSVPVGGVRFLDFQRAIDLLTADAAAFVDVRDEPLGDRRIAGVQTTGRRVTLVVPSGYRGNGEPIEMVDERWESAELRLLVQSRHSDSHGTIEYRLSNIRRVEPPARLFERPADYTVDYSSTPEDPRPSFASGAEPAARILSRGAMTSVYLR